MEPLGAETDLALDELVGADAVRVGAHQLAVELEALCVLAARRRGRDAPLLGQVEVGRRQQVGRLVRRVRRVRGGRRGVHVEDADEHHQHHPDDDRGHDRAFGRAPASSTASGRPSSTVPVHFFSAGLRPHSHSPPRRGEVKRRASTTATGPATRVGLACLAAACLSPTRRLRILPPETPCPCPVPRCCRGRAGAGPSRALRAPPHPTPPAAPRSPGNRPVPSLVRALVFAHACPPFRYRRFGLFGNRLDEPIPSGCYVMATLCHAMGPSGCHPAHCAPALPRSQHA